MRKKTSLSLGGILLALVAAFFLPSDQDPGESQRNAVGGSTVSERNAGAPVESRSASRSSVGFTSTRSLASHFAKHGRDFGNITERDYLERAKALRDAPLSEAVLELVRSDGVITRFDRRSGGFVAFHRDKSIRTFFRPNDGEPYFRRQAKR